MDRDLRVTLDGYGPDVNRTAFVAPTAVLVGDVHIGEQCSIWYGAVIRADTSRVSVGRRSNVQDLSLIHSSPELPVKIGDDVVIGHGVILHGSSVADGALLGNGCIVLNGSSIGAGSLVAAGTLVPPGTDVPPQSVVMGSPARVVRSASAEDSIMIQRIAQNYVERIEKYRQAHAAAEEARANR